MRHRAALRLGSRGAAPLLVAAVDTSITLGLAGRLGRIVPGVFGIAARAVVAARGQVLLVQLVFRLVALLVIRLALGEALVLALEQVGVHAVQRIAGVPAMGEGERGDEEREQKEGACQKARPTE